MTVTHHVGPALDIVRGLPDASIDLVATSPPFLALRNYNDVDGQWGSEATPAAFLDHLLELATELRRVLAPHGSIAFELGDTYSGSGGAGGDYNTGGLRDGQGKFDGSATRRGRVVDHDSGRRTPGSGWPLAKSLTGVPTLFAWSLAYGRNLLNPDHTFQPWRIRNVIVWARNNPPVGALSDKYRPATSYITVATPSARRWFDLDAVRGPASPNTHARAPKGIRRQPKAGKAIAEGRGGNWDTLDEIAVIDGSPPRDHWDDEYDGDTTWLINTVGSSLAHYAMWPASLAERLILSMCPAEVCRSCREPRRRIVAKNRPTPADDSQRAKHANGQRPAPGRQNRPPEVGWEIDTTTIGWSDCGHDNYRPGVVLDPFYGTGTTGAVADLHGRDAIGIDLDPTNTELHGPRYDEVKKSLFGVAPPMAGQLELLG